MLQTVNQNFSELVSFIMNKYLKLKKTVIYFKKKKKLIINTFYEIFNHAFTYQISILLDGGHLCAECTEKAAKVTCPRCAQYFCTNCDQVVHKLKINTSHERFPYSELRLVMCTTHKESQASQYCGLRLHGSMIITLTTNYCFLIPR